MRKRRSQPAGIARFAVELPSMSSLQASSSVLRRPSGPALQNLEGEHATKVGFPNKSLGPGSVAIFGHESTCKPRATFSEISAVQSEFSRPRLGSSVDARHAALSSGKAFGASSAPGLTVSGTGRCRAPEGGRSKGPTGFGGCPSAGNGAHAVTIKQRTKRIIPEAPHIAPSAIGFKRLRKPTWEQRQA